MPVRLVCAIVAGVAVRFPVWPVHCVDAALIGAGFGRASRGFWRVVLTIGAGCIGARVVSGAGFGLFRHGDNLKN